MNITIICDRCKKEIQGFKISGEVTGGYYEVGPLGNVWGKFSNPGERNVCDNCMWTDPRYVVAYGKSYIPG